MKEGSLSLLFFSYICEPIFMKLLYRLLLLFLLVFCGHVKATNTVVEDYDSLSRLSSEQLMTSGRVYFEQRQASKSLACFTIVAERFDESMDTKDLRMSIRAINNIGCVYKYFYFDYAQAYENFTRAVDLCESYHCDEFIPVVLVNLGDLLNDYGVKYVSQPMADQAMRIFERCVDEAMKSKNWEVLTTAFFNLSNQNFDLALDKFEVIFSSEIAEDTPDLQYVRLQYRGIEHTQKGQYDEALKCFFEQLSVVNARWEPERDTLSTLMSIAHVYKQKKDLGHAVDYLQKALLLSEQYHIDDHSAGICQLLSEYYRLMGNEALEREYHLRYLEKNEMIHIHRLASIGELTYVHELKKEQQRARVLAVRQKRQQYALLTGGFVLLVVLVSAGLLWRKNRELLARNKSLFEKTQQVMRVEEEQQKLRHTTTQSTENRESLILRIQEVLDAPEQICQHDFTVARLAKLVESNTTYVSQAINEKYGMAFSNVLGTYRVREACRRMNDVDHYGHVTIEAIATGVGFKSRTAFANAFKRETGLTPSEYLRMASSVPSSSET